MLYLFIYLNLKLKILLFKLNFINNIKKNKNVINVVNKNLNNNKY